MSNDNRLNPGGQSPFDPVATAIDFDVLVPLSVPIALVAVLVLFAYGKRGDEMVPADEPTPDVDLDELPYIAVREGVIQ